MEGKRSSPSLWERKSWNKWSKPIIYCFIPTYSPVTRHKNIHWTLFLIQSIKRLHFCWKMPTMPPPLPASHLLLKGKRNLKIWQPPTLAGKRVILEVSFNLSFALWHLRVLTSSHNKAVSRDENNTLICPLFKGAIVSEYHTFIICPQGHTSHRSGTARVKSVCECLHVCACPFMCGLIRTQAWLPCYFLGHPLSC